MTSIEQQPNEGSRGRRQFLGQIAAGAGGLALASLVSASESPLYAAATTTAADPEHWLDPLKAKHRQVVDAFVSNDGWPLAFAYNFVATATPAGSSAAVLVLRHVTMPLAVDSSVWTRYKVGESLGINDPATGKPATHNPFYQPAPGSLFVDDMAVDRLLKSGVIVGACGVALAVLSEKLAANAGVSKEQAQREWTAGIIPGITVLPSGVWGVNRAQEKGCTYCTGG
jgi:hypothetical protein